MSDRCQVLKSLSVANQRNIVHLVCLIGKRLGHILSHCPLVVLGADESDCSWLDAAHCGYLECAKIKAEILQKVQISQVTVTILYSFIPYLKYSSIFLSVNSLLFIYFWCDLDCFIEKILLPLSLSWKMSFNFFFFKIHIPSICCILHQN